MSQKEIRNVFTIRNAESVDGEMYLEGISEPGAPNKRGLMLDAETSWPHIKAYVEEFETRTDGASKGALRAMHDAHREIGKIVNVDFDQSPAIPVRVHVVSEEAKRFVEERVLNAFSWNWAVVGSMWEDKEASKKFGRKVMKYTGRPIELSLVDAPGIPETGFNVIANFDEGEQMPEEDPVIVPEVAPEVANAEVAPETVANGLYTAGRFGEHIEGLKCTLAAISAEEAMEGQSNAIPAELQEAIASVAAVYAKYAVAQVAELIGEDGEDAEIEDLEDIESVMDDDGVENGDFPGHPFRGNQHKKGSKRGGTAKARTGHKLSRSAAVSSAYAKGQGKKAMAGHHDTAATNHRAAAEHHAKAGNKKLAAYHTQKAGSHESTASAMRARVGNSDTAPESSVVLDALTALSARFDALEAKVSNSDRAPAPIPAPPARPAPIAVFHDNDQGGRTIQNADIPAFASLEDRAAILSK